MSAFNTQRFQQYIQNWLEKKKSHKDILFNRTVTLLCLSCKKTNSIITEVFGQRDMSRKCRPRSNAIFNDQSFNDTLTNDIFSFEQLGPES